MLGVAPRVAQATMCKHKTARAAGKPRVIYFVRKAQRLLQQMRRENVEGHVLVNERGRR
jgi:hypothetical protein